MILPHFILFFSVLFCVCSALKFSTPKRIYNDKHDIWRYIKMKHDTRIQVATKGSSGLSLDLSLKDNILESLSGRITVCSYSKGTTESHNSIEGIKKQLSSGDVLIFGFTDTNAWAVRTVLKEISSNQGFNESKFSEKLLEKAPGIECFFVTIEDDKAEKIDAGLTLKFSQFLDMNSKNSPGHGSLRLKSDTVFQAAFGHDYAGNVKLTLSPKEHDLEWSGEDHLICIYRENSIQNIYRNVKAENAKLSPGDIVISGPAFEADKIIRALDKLPPSSENSEGIDFLRKISLNIPDGVFAVAVKEDDKADADLKLKFSKLEREPKNNYMDSVSRHDDSIEIAPKSSGAEIKASFSLEEDKLKLSGDDFFLCICRNKKIEGFYQNISTQDVRLIPGDVLVFGESYKADKVIFALDSKFLEEKDLVNADSINKSLDSIHNTGTFVVSIEKNDA